MQDGDSNSNQQGTEIDVACGRAAFYSTLAMGFQPPDDEFLCRLLSPDGRSCLRAAATMLYPRQRELLAAIDALPGGKATRSALASKYRALFGHTAHGRIPPYETEYGNEALFQQPQELGDIVGFYRAFGLALKREHHERPDHVSCQCEFLMFLALKEQYALEQRQQDMLVETRKAEKLFLRDHLARFFPTFASRLGREDPDGFYGRLGELGLRFIAAECAQFKVNLGAANLGLRPADDSRVPMACGNGAECALMPGAAVPDESEEV